uniref:polynucleotide adenylyltransferase n=1 Tax=Meloidogyne enterolobii TaxID=390850 RepID=A0A6V7VX74_MELEN|nr:unnamed protein product [Meloidogyne enterolobii]
MENYWGRIRGKLISKNSDERTRTLGNELHYFLIEILKVTEGKLNKEALSKIKENLYLEKISKYFVDFIGINWSVLNANQRQFVKEILNLENNKDLNEWTLKIEKRVEELKLIKEQVEIDSSEKLLQVYLHPAGFRPLSENKNWEDASSNVHHNDITTIKSFKTLFEQWKNEKSKQDKEILKFQLFMSSPLNKEGGHIHAIVLAIGAGKVEYEIIKGLFIDKASKSLTLFNSTCSDNSLYCHLFKTTRKHSLNGRHKILPISDENIYYEISGTEFVITFICNKEERKAQNDTKWIEPFMRKISKNLNKIGNNKEKQQNAFIFYNLSLLKTYEYLEELFINKNEKERNIFNQAFIALKNWARANCIYNSQFGFLDGTSISLMLTKVFLLYPEANIIELVERFFIIFSTWDWHVPLRIKSKQNNEENQEDTKKKFMTVYIPVYPEHSVTSKITKTNQQIILNALLNGLEKVVKFSSNQPNKNEFVYMKNNAEGSEFIKTYEHFIVFSCITEDETGEENYCGFLENLDKINDQIEKINQIEIHHIGLKTEDCPTVIQKIMNTDGHQVDFEEEEQSESIPFCTSWLAGIKINNETFDKEMLKFELENGVKATGVTKNLKIFVILKEEIEDWGFEVNQNVELM